MKKLLIAVFLLAANYSVGFAGQNDGCAGMLPRQTAVVALPTGGTSAATTLIPHNGLKVIYLCAINIGPVSAAINVALAYGTKTSTPCDTGTTGLFGGTTSNNGWNFAINNGLTYGNGVGIVAIVPAGQDLCIFQTAGIAQPPGGITYAQY